MLFEQAFLTKNTSTKISENKSSFRSQTGETLGPGNLQNTNYFLKNHQQSKFEIPEVEKMEELS